MSINTIYIDCYQMYCYMRMVIYFQAFTHTLIHSPEHTQQTHFIQVNNTCRMKMFYFRSNESISFKHPLESFYVAISFNLKCCLPGRIETHMLGAQQPSLRSAYVFPHDKAVMETDSHWKRSTLPWGSIRICKTHVACRLFSLLLD